MKRLLTPILTLFALVQLSAQEANNTISMKDLFATSPESIFPLLTLNNKLDCIDFAEANMETRVRNRFGDNIYLDTLTQDYMKLRESEISYIEMKIVDSLLCVVRTYNGPEPDSHVAFYNLHWEPQEKTLVRPQVTDFLPNEEQDPDVLSELQGLTLMRASLSPDTYCLTWAIQTGELSKQTSEKARNMKFHPILVNLK